MSEVNATDPDGKTARIVKGAFAAVIALTEPSPAAEASAKTLEAQGMRVTAVAAGPPNALKLLGLVASDQGWLRRNSV